MRSQHLRNLRISHRLRTQPPFHRCLPRTQQKEARRYLRLVALPSLLRL